MDLSESRLLYFGENVVDRTAFHHGRSKSDFSAIAFELSYIICLIVSIYLQVKMPSEDYFVSRALKYMILAIFIRVFLSNVAFTNNKDAIIEKGDSDQSIPW